MRRLIGAALLASLLLHATAAGSELANLVESTAVRTTGVAFALFSLGGAGDSLVVRWNVTGEGNLLIAVSYAQNGTAAFTKAVDATAGRGSEVWSASEGRYNLTASYEDFLGDFVVSVAFVAGSSSEQYPSCYFGGPGCDDAPQVAVAPAGEKWLSPSMVLQIAGVTATLGITLYGLAGVRRKHRRLADRIDQIERAVTSHQTDGERLQRELRQLKQQFKEELRRDTLDQRAFSLLDSRIDEHLRRYDPQRARDGSAE